MRDVDQADAGALCVAETGTDPAKCLGDDLEAPPGLDGGIGVDLAVVERGRHAGDEHPVTGADGPAVSDGQLPGRPPDDTR